MFTAEQFRAKAAQSAESMKNTDIPSEVSKFQQSMESFSQLAQNEDWLADNYDKMLHSQELVPSQDLSSQVLSSEDLSSQDLPSQDAVVGTPFDRDAVAKSEEKILRCLGAAVIMQWNTIPAKLQRELFDTAFCIITRTQSEAPHELIPVLATSHSRALDTVGRRAYSFRGSGGHELRHA
jgi:hypothetical protein